MKLEYQFIKKKDGYCSKKEQFISLLSSSDDIDFKDNKLIFKNTEFGYGISCSNIKAYNEVLFHLIVDSNTDKNVALLEELKGVLEKLLSDNGFSVFSLWDDVSGYYTKKLYPEISYIENKARSIIYLLLTKAGGSAWTNRYIPKKVKEKYEGEKENYRFDDSNLFYNLDFIDIATFLFTRYQLNYDINKLLSNLDKNKTEKEIKEIVKNYENKSNWERFFKDLAGKDSLESEFVRLYEYRNIVAHNRRINEKEYNDCLNLIKVIKEAFNNIYDKINDVTIASSEAKTFREIYSGLLKYSEDLRKTIASLPPIDNSILEATRELSGLYGSIKVDNESTKTLTELYSSLIKDNQIRIVPFKWYIDDSDDKDKKE